MSEGINKLLDEEERRIARENLMARLGIYAVFIIMVLFASCLVLVQWK